MEELRNKNKDVFSSDYLSNLKKLKQNSTYDFNENLVRQTVKGEDASQKLLLEVYFAHHSEECRLEMLALLVESKKSTLQFSSKALDMILLFLKYNLCEKMEYVPLIKKALKRFRDSLAVMRRQLAKKIQMKNYNKKQEIASETHGKPSTVSDQTPEQIERDIKDYAMFFMNLREVCVNNLYPDATYHRRRSSLQILMLTQELLYNEFKDIEWKKEQVEIIFQCLLLDTYEPNKEMAYQLLKCSNPALLYLDSKLQVELIIKVALELGNSMRPIDSVTAAYMLKISMLSPVIKDVLGDYFNAGDNITKAITLQLILLLYKKLQASVLAKQNIGTAIVKCSLYGYLFCMRSLLANYNLGDAKEDKSWQSAVASIISLCSELSDIVSVIVNNSSPEGHLPMDLKTLNLNDNDGDASFSEKEIVTPQMVLLCSWHTVKEVSLLFGLLATEASIQTSESKDGLLTTEQVEQITKHLVSLLCETKHRGAFEQAYVGFHQVCTRLWQLTDTTLNALPVRYLHNTLIGITGFMPGYSKLCATRRSAGVPFLIQAVLSSALKTDKRSKKYFFHAVMRILLRFANLENTVDLWQEVKRIIYEQSIFSNHKVVMERKIENGDEDHDGKVKPDIIEIKTHSMNILRALFRHSQFGDMVEKYIADGLIVAFKSYNSNTWAERNAATLLFSALIIRIFGVQRTKDHINLTPYNTMTGRSFFEKYPSVLPFILEKLETSVVYDITMKSKVQAILLLLSRLYINDSTRTDNTWKRNELCDLVSNCATSPVYQTRELAARALVPLLTENTAYEIVISLFSLFKTFLHGNGANSIHGILLQILIIIRKFPSVLFKELFKEQRALLDLDSSTILKTLLNHTDNKYTVYGFPATGFNSFPVATVYIDILQELYEAEKDILFDFETNEILDLLQLSLIDEDPSKSKEPWPSEQVYKVSAIRLMLCIGKYSNALQRVHNGQSRMFKIYSRLLITPEAEVQNIAWKTVSVVLTKEQNSEQRELLGNYAIRAAADFTDLHEREPDVQDALFDFLYKCLMSADEWFVADAADKRREICTLVLRQMHSHSASNVYAQRVSYLRLLGKCMAILTHELTDETLEMEYKEDVYRKVCDSEWIGSLCEDLRSSVFDILHELFGEKEHSNAEQCQPALLDWWTVVLQLLIDDNMDVRREASRLICSIGSPSKLECIEKMLSVFFEKFKNIVADKCPGIAITALFCWSVSLLGDTDYEMDETEVFNKCRNYDVFEPVKISKMCYALAKSIAEQYSIDSALPRDTVKWINYRLDTNFTTLSFRDIVRCYMNNVPKIGKGLVDILDPTYRDKLLQILACENYATL